MMPSAIRFHRCDTDYAKVDEDTPIRCVEQTPLHSSGRHNLDTIRPAPEHNRPPRY
jgi:hypothetical protein